MNMTGKLATTDEKRAEVLNCLASVFNGNLSSLAQGKDWGNRVPHTIREEKIHDSVKNLIIQKSMGPAEIHPRILRELVDVVTKLLSMMIEKPCQSDQFGFPVHAYKASFSDVYGNILLFNEKLAKCLGKPGMVSNS
ncbi:hypothetical protein WISP_13222 [Willisornis vidua]|uniref:Uncharacterized protein n=1 Tax=Willisornis vidua TaxID=1566151 RepID=A0ABQ9DW93_9PASS|nr:hypothetical protein WISP_13222 [Willisornis vidua]